VGKSTGQITQMGADEVGRDFLRIRGGYFTAKDAKLKREEREGTIRINHGGASEGGMREVSGDGCFYRRATV
jgi:hypothetical protein